MIDQNRVRQMSRLAMMEPEIKKDVMGICSRRKADYVVLQILKGFFAGTVCYAALLLLWLGFLWDGLNAFFADAHYEAFIGRVLLGYGTFMLAYLVICGLTAAVRYKKGGKQKHIYLKYLKHLIQTDSSDEEEEEHE